MAGDGSIFSFHTTANTLNRDGKPAFQIYTDVMRVFSQENFVFGFQQSKSLLSLRVRWLVRAWLQGPKCARVFKHTAAAAPPRYRGQTVGSAGTGHCREEERGSTHTQRIISPE